MKKHLSLIVLSSIHFCLSASSINNQPELKFIGGNNRVLTPKFRISVLEATDAFLNRSDGVLSAGIGEVIDPYGLDGASDTEEETATATAPVVYDDASVLDVIQANLAKQIRGTIAKGNTYFLQLNGGGMLKAGDSFPAKIPQLEGQSFTITIVEITSKGYSIKLNNAIQSILFEKTSGIIKNSDK